MLLSPLQNVISHSLFSVADIPWILPRRPPGEHCRPSKTIRVHSSPLHQSSKEPLLSILLLQSWPLVVQHHKTNTFAWRPVKYVRYHLAISIMAIFLSRDLDSVLSKGISCYLRLVTTSWKTGYSFDQGWDQEDQGVQLNKMSVIKYKYFFHFCRKY